MPPLRDCFMLLFLSTKPRTTHKKIRCHYCRYYGRLGCRRLPYGKWPRHAAAIVSSPAGASPHRGIAAHARAGHMRANARHATPDAASIFLPYSFFEPRQYAHILHFFHDANDHAHAARPSSSPFRRVRYPPMYSSEYGR